MSNIAEKVFDFYLALPAETRMMIIDEMEPVDRCRFTRSSVLCGMEVRKSKNYIHALELVVYSESSMHIGVRHGYEDTIRQRVPYGFDLSFNEKDSKVGKKYVKYTIPYSQKLWEIELDSSTDMVQLFVDNFKLLLQAYQNIVKRVMILGSIFETDKYKNYDFGIKHMNNLEVLEFCCVGIGQFISKTRRPLKTVSSNENLVLADFEQISRVQEWVDMTNLKLNYDQFSQLSAKYLQINMGELTEIDVINFIKSWQNGTIRDTFHECTWEVDRSSSFDFQKIVRFFGIKPTDSRWGERYIINHNKENDKKAEICESGLGVIFEDLSKRN